MKIQSILIITLFVCTLVSCTKECPPDELGCITELEKNLIAYYPFNGNANDESGNGNNGVVNGAFFTTDLLGRPGKAAGFDGINDHIIVNDNGKLAPAEITISMMVLVNNTNRRHAILNHVDFQTAKGAVYGVGQALDNTNRWEFTAINKDCNTTYVYNEADYATSSEALQAGRWYHLLTTFSKGVQKLYVNGELRATKTREFNALPNCSAGQLVIGGWWKNDIVSIDGKVDEIRIYNRVLEECEIGKLTEIFK
ncbi:MAG: LamG domain-containing protein [Chitinophagaceae bacterium]